LNGTKSDASESRARFLFRFGRAGNILSELEKVPAFSFSTHSPSLYLSDLSNFLYLDLMIRTLVSYAGNAGNAGRAGNARLPRQRQRQRQRRRPRRWRATACRRTCPASPAAPWLLRGHGSTASRACDNSTGFVSGLASGAPACGWALRLGKGWLKLRTLT